MREAFAMQKLLTFFQQKYWHIWDINVWNFNETLTNDVVSFEQLSPGTKFLLPELQRATIISIYRIVRKHGRTICIIIVFKHLCVHLYHTLRASWKLSYIIC